MAVAEANEVGILDYTARWQLNNALWQSCNMSEKINKKVYNFGNWFLCQFLPKTHQFLHEGFLTPQEWGDEKKIEKIDMQGG